MKKATLSNIHRIKSLVFLLLLVTFMGNAQIMQVKVKGGAIISNGSTITITAGNSLQFEITNTETGNCRTVNVQDINLSGSTGTSSFSISPSNPSQNIKPSSCNGTTFLDFTVTRNDSACTSGSTLVTIYSNEATFSFTLTVNRAPIISVLGGSPSSDIIHGTTTTTATNGTYYGIVEEGAVKTRNYIIANTGSCPLNIGAITSSLTDFQVAGYVLTPIASYPYYTPAGLPTDIAPGSHIILIVSFVAPITDPKTTGTLVSTISILNTDNTIFTFNVSAEMFNVNIPGPGGVTANFRLWLKSTRGVVSTLSKVSEWKDLGVNGKSAKQTTSTNQPTYLDNAASNINFNPVIKFENNGGSLNQYLENTVNGFYSQDIFIVMVPDADVSASSAMTIFSGTVAGNIAPENYVNDINELTGVGLGNFTTNLTGGRLWYNQGSTASSPYYSLPASSGRAYDKAGIINARNKTVTPSDGMSILFNTVDDAITATKTITTFANFGYIDTVPDPDVVWGTPYKIGKNANGTYGNLNGRVAEIMTFAERVPDVDRPKIETYLAIKYGITLGATTAEKNYVNSAGIAIWDITANAEYNYNVAGIGKDNASDLNQKQSKSINDTNEVTIGLGGIFATNSANSNDFSLDKEFLVWGCNNGAYTGVSTNEVTIATDITTSLTRIDRKWKIVESGGDVENIFVSIPSTELTTIFGTFTKTTEEEFVLIVSETKDFTNADIVDVIPMKRLGSNHQTWYDFDGTKFFTFGKAPKLSGNRQVNIAAGDYLVGEYALNLNINAFTISAWVKSVPSANTRTIMAKGSKLQLRLSAANKIEVMVDDDATPRFTSDMILNDSKWHNITFIYASGTVFLYIDGILDKSVQGVEPPTPNYNHFSIGAVYIDKNQILRPFLGEIDEVYVWDQGLTQDQVRYLMNQEIERFAVSSIDYANGKVLPQAAASNEVTTIPWSKLRAYYDFNTFYGSTVDGKTDLRNFLRIKYLNKTKPITNTQTAPLPYVSQGNGTWDTPETWLNNAVQKLPNSFGLDGTTKVDWNIVETSHNISSGDKDITVLALKNNSGTITIADPVVTVPVENNAGRGLRITHYLELDGVIDLVGESQLIQDEGSILDKDSGGYIERDQQGTANSFNYNYWSSSVGPISGNSNSRGTGVASINENFTLDGVLKDGSSNINFQAPYTAADSGPSTPITISTYWLYTFNAGNNNYSSWNRINQNTPLLAGEGYTMKGSSGAVAITNNQNYVFKGKPYNGDFTLPITAGGDRLIGNPYSSAMDANEFILDNIKENINGRVGRNAANVFNGALYFWDHFGERNSHYLKEYVGGYATYTLMGGTKAIANDARINTTSGILSSKEPQQYIPVGQGFFVIAELDILTDSTTTTVDGGDIVFKNSQRVFVRESTPNSVFMKAAKSKTSGKETAENKVDGDSRPKIWLQFDSPTGYHRQLLVGLDENTSNNFDLGYDAPIADVGKEDIYWTFSGSKFVIQAVNNFNNEQELPLGLKISKTGLVRIKIDKIENLNKNLLLYIKDKLTNETFEITEKPFEIMLDAGAYQDRFALTFKLNMVADENAVLMDEEVLVTVKNPLIAEDVSMVQNEQPLNIGIHVFMNNAISELQINNVTNTEILNINLFNNVGQLVNSWNKNLNKRDISLPVHIATGIYNVQITTKNGTTVKKIMVE